VYAAQWANFFFLFIFPDTQIEIMDYLRKLLKPDKKKVILTVLLPIVVLFAVTGSLETLLDFYGYLLTPTMGVYDGTRTYRRFNNFILLWIPFYILACIILEIGNKLLKRTQ
jgi:hypothetical protein